MPEVRNDIATCFVHGHGASFSSRPDGATSSVSAKPRDKIVTPLASALESAKIRAAAQLALQRGAICRIEKK